VCNPHILQALAVSLGCARMTGIDVPMGGWARPLMQTPATASFQPRLSVQRDRAPLVSGQLLSVQSLDSPSMVPGLTAGHLTIGHLNRRVDRCTTQRRGRPEKKRPAGAASGGALMQRAEHPYGLAQAGTTSICSSPSVGAAGGTDSANDRCTLAESSRSTVTLPPPSSRPNSSSSASALRMVS
jgi:hypothetical protein